MLLLLLAGCEARRGQDLSGTAQGDTIALRHATNLTLVRQADSFVVATLANPWDSTKTLHSYLLVPGTVGGITGEYNRREQDADGATVVRVPLRRAAVYTALHASLLIELGCLEQIGGVCDAEYIAAPEICERVADGRVNNYGYGLNPNLELIMDTHPDALMPSPFENAGYGGVEKLDIPIIECADYMERSPLGQAEWMRFYGMLFGCEAKADSLFAEVERAYTQLAESVGACADGGSSSPKVLCDNLLGSTWFVPGSNSTMARLIADAGGDYIFAGLGGAGSVSLTFETVLDRAEDADIWLIKYNAPEDYTLRSLAAENRGYTLFRAYREGRVYGCNTAKVPFFEESRFHPERVLSDLVGIFTDGRDGRYYKRIR